MISLNFINLSYYEKAINAAEKAKNKRMKKVAIGSALIGTAAGLGMNHLMKKEYKRANRERRSKSKNRRKS